MTWQEHWDAGRLAWDRVQDAEAEAGFRRALGEAEALGEADPRLARTLHRLAQACEALGRHAEALELYTRGVLVAGHGLGQDSAERLELLRGLGRLQSRLDRPAEAAASLLEAQEAVLRAEGPDALATLDTLRELARALLEGGAYQEALERLVHGLRWTLERLGAEHPRYAAACVDLAQFYLRVNQLDAAAPFLEVALGVLERSEPRGSELARALAYRADLILRTEIHVEDRAIELYERAIEIEQAQPRPTELLAWLLSALASVSRTAFWAPASAPERLLPLLERALSVHELVFGANSPRSRPVLELYAREMPVSRARDIFINRGAELFRLGDTRGAIEEMSRALELEPDNPLALSNRAQMWGLLGEHGKVIEDATRLLELEPDSVEILAHRSLARYRTGDLRGALADSDRALELDPGHHKLLRNRARYLAELGEDRRALADYDRLLEREPQDASLLNDRAMARLGLHDARGALRDLDAALRLRGDFHRAWINRALVHERLGDLRSSVADSTRALELEPRDATELNNRGCRYCGLGELDLALADLRAALALEPNLAVAHCSLAELHTLAGRIDAAIEALERAIELDPQWRGYARSAEVFAPLRRDPRFQRI